jgi:peroxiredoxin
MTRQKILALIGLGIICVNSLWADPSWDIAKIGDRPFQFSGVSTDGAAISLAALHGKVVLVYLFSTETGAGMMELKMIEKYVWPRFESVGLSIIGVVREAKAPEVTAVARSMNIGFPLIPDSDKAIFLHFATRGHPRAYLIGKDGNIKLTSLGYSDDELDRISSAIFSELQK